MFLFQAEYGIRYYKVTGVQTCALPISSSRGSRLTAAATTPEAESSTSCGTLGSSLRPVRLPIAERHAEARMFAISLKASDRKSVVEGKRQRLGERDVSARQDCSA